MKSTVFPLIFAVFALASFSFCKKTELTEPPIITFESASKTILAAGQDSLVLTISYTDGDGDLGENNPDALNCFVQDSRSPALLYRLRIKQLAPDGSKIAINGKLDLVIPPTGLVDDSKAEETAVFSIKITDRAGHESNLVESPAIKIQH